MHGLGNDFVVIDAINQQVDLNSAVIQFMADRHRGIGCDQLLLVESPSNPNHDFKYRIFNADGGEVAQCGNGARCFAQFVRDKGLTEKSTIAVETVSGVIYPTIEANGLVRVDMGMPQFEPAQIPFYAVVQSDSYELVLADNTSITISALSMGNPHAVLVVDSVATTAVEVLGPQIESHADFPDRVNAGFMEILDNEHIKLRVYERGAGETQACGTGACAAVVSGIQQGLLAREVQVSLPGGNLFISWPVDDASVWMTGPATHVFDGEIEWELINQC